MSTTRIMSRTRILTCIPTALALAAIGAGCRNESERAEGAVRDQAKEVRDQAGKVRDETRELGSDIRELQKKKRDAWTQAGKDGNYKVEFNPDGAVVASKQQPPSGMPPSDDAMQQVVTSKLSSSPQGTLINVTATVDKGVVTLRGNVPTFKDATTAVNDTLNTEGVSKVVSYLNYGP